MTNFKNRVEWWAMAGKKESVNPWPEVLSELLTATGWTQQQAADEIGVSRRQWIRWETEGVTPIGPAVYALRCMVRTHAPTLLEKLPK